MKNLGIAILLMATTASYGQTKIKITPQDKTTTPVSEKLWGSFYELGFGRSDIVWGELLFDRGFENIKPISKSNPWYEGYCGNLDEAIWMHSGYEEPKWYILKDGKNKTGIELFHQNYWPAGHGKYFVKLDASKEPLILAQDRIWVKKGVPLSFSALFANGHYLDAEKYTQNATPVTITLYKEGDLKSPVAKTTINVNTHQLNPYSSKFDNIDYEGFCTIAIEAPEGSRVGVDQLSLMSDDNIKGWKKETIEKIRNEIKPHTLRAPGGCFSSLYDWRMGVGPRDKRAVSYDTWWGCEMLNDVGTFEMYDLAKEIGAELFLCVPLMFDDEYNAADWVDFCNNPKNELRAAYGRKEPLNVKYWELENEPYRRFDAITYAQTCVKFAKAMKAKDPSIKIAAGNYWAFNKKFPEMLEIMGPYVDLITNRGGSVEEMAKDIELLNAYNAKHGTNIQLCHTEYRAPLKRESGAVDGLNQAELEDGVTMFNRASQWGYAMNMVEQFFKYQNFGNMFFTANVTNMTDGWGECLINTTKDNQVYLNTAGTAFSLLNSLDIAYPQTVDFDNKNLAVQAAWNKERNKLTIVLLNFNTKEEACTLDLQKFKKKFAAQAKGYKITPDSQRSYNSPEKPENVHVEQFSQKAGKSIKMKLAPESLYVLEL